MRRSGFTLIELIFVIVVIGILAAVAIPKFKNLKQNAAVANVIQAVTDLNGSGGASAYLNAVELNGIKRPDLNITDIYRFQGKGWTQVDEDHYDYNSTNGDLNASFTYNNNGIISISIQCAQNSAYDKALEAQGLNCGGSYTINLDTLE